MSTTEDPDYDSRGSEEAVSVTMARGDLRGAPEVQRREDLPCHSYLDAPLVKDCHRGTEQATLEAAEYLGPMCKRLLEE